MESVVLNKNYSRDLLASVFQIPDVGSDYRSLVLVFPTLSRYGQVSGNLSLVQEATGEQVAA
jgi:hypothetical protein